MTAELVTAAVLGRPAPGEVLDAALDAFAPDRFAGHSEAAGEVS